VLSRPSILLLVVEFSDTLGRTDGNVEFLGRFRDRRHPYVPHVIVL